MTGRQSRIGDVSDAAARALELADRIAVAKQPSAEFWLEGLKRLILDLDERGLGPEVIRAGDMLAAAWGRIEDKPAETEALWPETAARKTAGSRTCPFLRN